MLYLVLFCLFYFAGCLQCNAETTILEITLKRDTNLRARLGSLVEIEAQNGAGSSERLYADTSQTSTATSQSDRDDTTEIVTTISERTCATNDEECFSFSFNNLKELKKKLKNDKKLRQLLRQHLINEMQEDEQSREISFCAENSENTATFQPDPGDSSPTTTAEKEKEMQAPTPVATTSASTTITRSICVSHESNMTNWNGTNSSCISIFENEKVGYEDAKSYCEKIGGRLAAKGIRDQTIVSYLSYNDSLLRFRRDKFKIKFWIGLQSSSEIWEWSDNGTYTKNDTYWDTDGEQPEKNDENCALLEGRRNWKLHDYPCNRRHQYICEK